MVMGLKKTVKKGLIGGMSFAKDAGKINWFPGHMAAATRAIRNRLKLSDFVIEVRDARIPLSSANEDLQPQLSAKRRIIALNKKDLANPNILNKWTHHFESKQQDCIAINAHSRSSVKKLLDLVELKLKEVIAREPTLLVMVVGVPNVGKSALINSVHQIAATRFPVQQRLKRATVGPLPGVTQDIAGFKIAHRPSIYVLDSPGVLVPSIPDIETGLKLALSDEQSKIIKEQALAEDKGISSSFTPDGGGNEPEQKRPALLCKFFAKRRCNKGSSCRFLHAKENSSDTSQQQAQNNMAGSSGIQSNEERRTLENKEGVRISQLSENGKISSHTRQDMSFVNLPGCHIVGYFSKMSSEAFVETDPSCRYRRYGEILRSSGAVEEFRAFDKGKGINVSWSKVKLGSFSSDEAKINRLQMKISLLKSVKSNNIIPVFKVWRNKSENTLNIISEICTWNLEEYLKQYRLIIPLATTIKKWCKQILKGLDILHTHEPRITHGDVTCTNVFINDTNGLVKIGGFASAVTDIGSNMLDHRLSLKFKSRVQDIYTYGLCVANLVAPGVAYYQCGDPITKSFIERCIAQLTHETPYPAQLLLDPFFDEVFDDDEEEDDNKANSLTVGAARAVIIKATKPLKRCKREREEDDLETKVILKKQKKKHTEKSNKKKKVGI